MKRRLAILTILIAALSSADTVHLDDGSRLEGEVLQLDAEHLQLSTDFAGTLTLERSRVAAIIFDDDFAMAPTGAMPAAVTIEKPAEEAPEGTGLLEVSIKGDPVKSSVRYRHENEAEEMRAINTLHLRVYVNGLEYAHASDGEMDKEFRQGKWIVLRNSHRFDPLLMEVPAGRHRIQIVVGNDVSGFEDHGDQDTLSSEVIVEDVDIVPDQKTRVTVKGKGGRLGSYGHFEMELLSSR